MQDEGDKVIICERGDLVFVFNFHPSQSFSDYKVGCKNAGSYKVPPMSNRLAYPQALYGIAAQAQSLGSSVWSL